MKWNFYLQMDKNVRTIFLAVLSWIIVYMYTLRGVPQTQSPHQSPHIQKKKGKRNKRKRKTWDKYINYFNLSNIYFDYKNVCYGIWPWDFLEHFKYDFIHKIFMDMHSLGKLKIVVQCKAQLHLGIYNFFKISLVNIYSVSGTVLGIGDITVYLKTSSCP